MATVRKTAVRDIRFADGVVTAGTEFDCPVENVPGLEAVGAIPREDGSASDAGADQAAGDSPEDDEGSGSGDESEAGD